MELEDLEVGAIYRVKPLVERGFGGLGAFVGPVTCQFVGRRWGRQKVHKVHDLHR